MYEAFTAGEKDYSALVSKIKKNNIDAVYLGTEESRFDR